MSENKIPTEVVEVEETTIETKETFKEMSPIRLIL